MTQTDVHAPALPVATAAAQDRRFYSLAFWILLFAFEAFVLSLPLFPNGDGGLHIYYATVFRDLLAHSSPLYAHFYAVRHVIQPYLLHYYVFIGLTTFLSADMAEKIIVVIVIAVFALGFRSLVRALSPDSPGLVLLVIPFLLNWPLSMGALNYTFALGLLFFALGAYERFSRPGRMAPRLWRFVALLLLLVLSHPVPLLLLVCILGVDLLIRLWQAPAKRAFWSSERNPLLALAFSCLALIVPMLIADKSQVARTVSDIHFHVGYIQQIFNASRLTMLNASGFLGRLYNRLFMIVYPISLGLVVASGFFRRLRTRSFTGFDRLAIFSVLFLLASLFAPFELNGSGFFSFRLWLPCWLLGTAACSGALTGTAWNRATAAYGIVVSLIVLGLAIHNIRPIAIRSAEIEHASLPSGKTGLFVQSIYAQSTTYGMTYPVYWWNGGRAFITHNDVMLNSPWLFLTIIPVEENGQAGLLRDYTQQRAAENPNELSFYFSQRPAAERARALHDADFILFVDPRAKNPNVRALIRFTLEPYIQDWHCDIDGFYAICQKNQAS